MLARGNIGVTLENVLDTGKGRGKIGERLDKPRRKLGTKIRAGNGWKNKGVQSKIVT